jgi:hypothetical protein
MAIPNEDSPVVGSQRARQGQNVRGMRKVLIWGMLLTAIAFAVLIALFSAREVQDPTPVDLTGETNPSPTAPSQPPPASPPN